MAKKCIPGIICVENMTLFILILLSISVGYLYYKHWTLPGYGPSPELRRSVREDRFSGNESSTRVPYSYLASIPYTQTAVVTTQATEQSLYLNPIDVRGVVELPGIPVNIRTSTANTPYRQIGILTKTSKNSGGTDPLILPLFGRNLLNGRDKWQYYTVANSGGVAFNAKLPISVNGRSCTSEYGCDSVSNGDTVYVEGYDDTFRATIYENATMNYIPF